MIICPLVGSSLSGAISQVEAGKEADLFELRLDLSMPALKAVVSHLDKPFVLTLKSEADFAKLILNPDYIDVDISFSHTLADLRLNHPHAKIFASFHDFEKTPIHLPHNPAGSDFLKIACQANSIHDTLRLLQLTQKNWGSTHAIAMGPKGESTRIMTPWTYSPVSLDTASAPGQIVLQSLISDYKQKERIKHKDLYALIGDPVDKSISHKTHNTLIKEIGWDAVYLKFPVTKDELPLFMKEIREFDVRGLSVTMPLKEAILPYLDEIDEEAKSIGAVNTVVVGKKTIGYNTDGLGALDALQERISLKGKTMAILGKGGTARAIGWHAEKVGCHVIYLGRNPEPVDYDILVNATPVGMSPLIDEMPVPSSFLLPGKVVLECISNPITTKFLSSCIDCDIITGQELFINQAARQFALWQEAKEN